MNRRTFFTAAVSTLGILGLGRLLKMERAFAAGTSATEESLKGLPKASGVTAASFWGEGDNPPNIDHFCNAAKANPKCGPQRKDGQYCGNCALLTERSNFENNVVGKCALIQPPKPPKTHVYGQFYCAKYVPNAAVKYQVKS